MKTKKVEENVTVYIRVERAQSRILYRGPARRLSGKF